MRMRGLAVGLAFLLCGCVAGARVTPLTHSDDRLQPGDARVFAGDWRPVETVTFHEHADADSWGETAGQGWSDRDAVFEYDGLHLTFDAWARPVPAMVFRYAPMEVAGSPSGRGSSLAVASPRPTVYLFDAGDARFLGSIDLQSERRTFAAPNATAALPSGYEAPLLLAAGFDGWDGVGVPPNLGGLRFVPAPDDRPLAGDCNPYEVLGTGISGRLVVCLAQGSPLPLWVFEGSEGRAVTLQRAPGPFALPELKGSRPPPGIHTEPWTPVAVPGAGPVLAPTVHEAGDWADALAQRVAALGLDPDFTQYQAGHPGLAVEVGDVGLPPSTGFGLVFHESALLLTTNGTGAFMDTVETRNGSAGEPLHHVADPGGTPLDDNGASWVAAGRLPDLVPAAEVEARIRTVLPDATDHVTFEVVGSPAFRALGLNVLWTARGPCRPGAGAFFAVAEGTTGRVLEVGHMPSTDPDCSTAAAGWSPARGLPPTP